jgi:hypothetical protein
MQTYTPLKDERCTRLHAEAMRQLRWHQQRWQEILTETSAASPMLTTSADRDWFHGCLDMLRHAGEDVPQSFYRRGSVIRNNHGTHRAEASISLNALVADVTRALVYFADSPGGSQWPDCGN